MDFFDHNNIDEVKERLSEAMEGFREKLSEDGDNAKREQAMVMLLHILKKAEDKDDMTTAYAICNVLIVAVTSICAQIGYDPYNSEEQDVVDKTTEIMQWLSEMGMALI